MGGVVVEERRVVVIGAGSSGLCMAINLKKAGHDDILILEKASGLGGTWWHNSYPGAECDVQSHLYSFSFEQKNDWSQPFAGQAEILDYLNHCADKYDVRPHIRFETEVAAANWNEASGRWLVETTEGDVISAQILISALGMFNNIVMPEIAGMGDFEGTTFHSARWNHDHDLSGERVGVIGIAASAIQFVPQVAPLVGELFLYQRTANWVVPKGNTPYTQAQLDEFLKNPQLVTDNREEIYRTWNQLCTFQDKALMAEIEKSGLERIAEVQDPKTRERLTPNHPFGCRRPLFSDIYYPVFNRDNVELLDGNIERVTKNSIINRDGEERQVDTIIYSTGFETTTYLSAIDVRGREGQRLADAWQDGAQAYYGVVTAGFPNLFMLYGPNTNQGSILYMIEREVEYVMRQIERMDEENLAWIDVRPEVMSSFNERLQENVKCIDVWQAACGGDFYYRSKSGRFVTNWPATMDDYTEQTRKAARADDYEVS
ncbi:MAG: NAD(P)/FAD-dependent oxidoreductase, partial [Pseudomonadota bacterium]